MTYHYHIAAQASVESILTRGLLTDAEGWDTGYVWMFSDLDVAQADLPKWHKWRGGAVIIRVDVTGLNVSQDPHPGWGDHRDQYAKVVAHNVDPSRLEVVR